MGGSAANGEHAGSGIDMKKELTGNLLMDSTRSMCHSFILALLGPLSIFPTLPITVVCPTLSSFNQAEIAGNGTVELGFTGSQRSQVLELEGTA